MVDGWLVGLAVVEITTLLTLLLRYATATAVLLPCYARIYRYAPASYIFIYLCTYLLIVIVIKFHISSIFFFFFSFLF